MSPLLVRARTGFAGREGTLGARAARGGGYFYVADIVEVAGVNRARVYQLRGRQ